MAKKSSHHVFLVQAHIFSVLSLICSFHSVFYFFSIRFLFFFLGLGAQYNINKSVKFELNELKKKMKWMYTVRRKNWYMFIF